jgi:hypothetical protein
MKNHAGRGPKLKLGTELLMTGGLLLFVVSCAGGPAQNQARLPIGHVDAPTNGATVGSSLNAGGWALSEDGIDSISIYIDRTYLTSTFPNTERPDVLKAFPAFAGQKNLGWSLAVDLASLSSGLHEVDVQARSKKGAVRDIGSIQVTVSK